MQFVGALVVNPARSPLTSKETSRRRVSGLTCARVGGTCQGPHGNGTYGRFGGLCGRPQTRPWCTGVHE
jgi:hypothetical protein